MPRYARRRSTRRGRGGKPRLPPAYVSWRAVEDGDAAQIARYGQNKHVATFAQRRNRYLEGFHGRGDYTLGMSGGSVANNLFTGAKGAVPSFGEGGSMASSEGSLEIRHSEYIGNILGCPEGVSFQNQTYSINPGLEQTFPWFSQLAQNYDEYSMVSCVYTYRSMVTDFAANSGQVGQVYMATQYNNNDAPFTTTRAFLDYSSAVSGKTSQTIMCGVECDPSKLSLPGGKYTRTGPPLPGVDLNTLDSGVLNIAVVGTPVAYANQIMGQLWCSYVIQLRKPKSFVNQALGVIKDLYFQNTSDFMQGNWVGATGYDEFSTEFVSSGQQNRIGTSLRIFGLGVPVVTDTADCTLRFQLTFPAQTTGSFEIILATQNGGGPQFGNYGGLGLNPTLRDPTITFNLSSAATNTVTPVNDIWRADTAQVWYNQISSATPAISNSAPFTSVIADSQQVVGVGHINVVPSSDGLPNTCWVDLNVPLGWVAYGDDARSYFKNIAFNLSVSEYNVGLNGASGTPLLVSELGVAQAAPVGGVPPLIDTVPTPFPPAAVGALAKRHIHPVAVSLPAGAPKRTAKPRVARKVPKELKLTSPRPTIEVSSDDD